MMGRASLGESFSWTILSSRLEDSNGEEYHYLVRYPATIEKSGAVMEDWLRPRPAQQR